MGATADADGLIKIADRMAMRIVEAAGLAPLSTETEAMLLLPPLPEINGPASGGVDALTFSGGVSEYVYGNETERFGDLGPDLARLTREKIEATGANIEKPIATIRATVVGASQYTVQLSGTTIYIEPRDVVPLRNVPVIAPELDFSGMDIDPDQIKDAVDVALTRLDLMNVETPVAVGFRWKGSASFARLDQFGKGVQAALTERVAKGLPIVLVSDGDIGGLVGIHLREEMKLDSPVISIDGITLSEFDFIDIGAIIPSSGAVPVVIKSLVFPASATAEG